MAYTFLPLKKLSVREEKIRRLLRLPVFCLGLMQLHELGIDHSQVELIREHEVVDGPSLTSCFSIRVNPIQAISLVVCDHNCLTSGPRFFFQLPSAYSASFRGVGLISEPSHLLTYIDYVKLIVYVFFRREVNAAYASQ